MTPILAASGLTTAATAIIGTAAVVTALGVLWRMVVNPIRKAGNRAEAMYPLLVTLTEIFADHPTYFAVLEDIAAQFRTDSGSSLRDVVDRLETASVAQHSAAEVLKVGVEAARQLAERDRQQMMRMTLLIDRLDAKVAGGRDAIDRIESDRVEVAANLATAKATVAEVAANLVVAQAAVDSIAADTAASHERADSVTGPPGESADAAARSDPAALSQEWVQERRRSDAAAEEEWRASGQPDRRRP